MEASQKRNPDVTQRLAWFLGVLDQALCDAEAMLAATIRKSRFWESLAGQPINERQHMMLNRLTASWGNSSSKWAKIANCSQDTALRDIDALCSAVCW